VEVKEQMVSLIRWAKNNTQTGLPNEGPLQHIGITGTGRIIGVADTGMDDQSCFFKDKYAEFPYDYLNLSHRKVVYYNTYVDGEDQDGHGSAVAGTAAGRCGATYGFEDEDGAISSSDEASQYDGQAWDAKISFFDIGSGGGTSSSSLSVPGDAKNNLYKPLYNTVMSYYILFDCNLFTVIYFILLYSILSCYIPSHFNKYVILLSILTNYLTLTDS
jgi:subtilisin family serine protease